MCNRTRFLPHTLVVDVDVVDYSSCCYWQTTWIALLRARLPVCAAVFDVETVRVVGVVDVGVVMIMLMTTRAAEWFWCHPHAEVTAKSHPSWWKMLLLIGRMMMVVVSPHTLTLDWWVTRRLANLAAVDDAWSSWRRRESYVVATRQW
jgi:hypothetical protein